MGFDPMVNQRLLPPTFPRYTKIKPRIEALEYMKDLLNRFKIVTKIISYSSFHAALVSFQLQMSQFSSLIRLFVTGLFLGVLAPKSMYII